MGDYSDFTTEDVFNPDRWHYFDFYETIGADGTTNISINFGARAEIRAIRVHCSSEFLSVADFIVQRSAAVGSVHNNKWISQAMLSVQDYIVVFDSGEVFLASGDHLNFSMVQVSGVNLIGVNVTGWAALG
jgi:hypothetical protein